MNFFFFLNNEYNNMNYKTHKFQIIRFKLIFKMRYAVPFAIRRYALTDLNNVKEITIRLWVLMCL